MLNVNWTVYLTEAQSHSHTPQTQLSQLFWGSVSCSRTHRHVACRVRDQTNDLPLPPELQQPGWGCCKHTPSNWRRRRRRRRWSCQWKAAQCAAFSATLGGRRGHPDIFSYLTFSKGELILLPSFWRPPCLGRRHKGDSWWRSLASDSAVGQDSHPSGSPQGGC